MQDSSLSILAMTGENMAERGITNMVELAQEVPGLLIGAAGPALQLHIRGVGTDAATGFSSPGIAVSKDGVYIARATAMSASFFDIQRVEVLKGPQGTLYGRNATGGAVNLITNGAELNELSGYVATDLGNYDRAQLEGAINIPMGDSFATRLSALAVDRDGYMTDGTGDDERWSARISSLWTPTDTINWRFQGQYADFDGKGAGFTWAGSPDAWDSLFPGANEVLQAGIAANGFIAPDIVFPWIQNAPVVGPAPTPPFPPGTNLISLVAPIENDIEQDLNAWDVSTTFEWQAEFATLTVVAAYQEVEANYRSRPAVLLDVGRLFGADNPETSETTSLEARLSGDTDSLEWVVGVNIFSEQQEIYNAVNQGVIQNLQIESDLDTDALGLFGEVTYSLTEKLHLIAGLRYSDEEQEKSDFSRYFVDESIGCPPPLTTIVAGGVRACQISGPEDRTISDDNLDWKLGAEYDLTEDSMVFFTASTGFKAGGLPAVSSSGFDAEFLTAFTLGTKNILMDGRLQLNGEVFYWEYEDKQENLVGPDDQGIIGLDVFNAGESTQQGISMDIRFAATDRDFFTFAFEYLDAEYDDFSYFQGAAVTPPTTCATTETGNLVPGPAGPTPELFVDCSGLQMTKAPEWSGNASFVHTFDLGEHGELDAKIDVIYTDERWLTANFLAEQLVDDFTIWNAHIAYRSNDGKFSALAYVQNIGEEESYHVSLNHTQVPQLVGLGPGAPRTYGVRLRYNF
ncbi:MAG: TonB-dependent receptor [Pseudomonadota bacterium]